MTTVLDQQQATAEHTAHEQHVRDEVLRGLWRKGRACTADLAGDLSTPMPARDVLPVMEDLEREGLIREIDDPAIPATSRYQAVFELVR